MLQNVKKWYVLKVRPRHEKAIARLLSEDYEIFLPLINQKKQWSDRVKVIETPLFSGYLFIRTSLNNKYYIVDKQGVSAFVQFGDKPAVIRDEEIKAISLLIKSPDTLKVKQSYDFSEGEKIKINRGVFAGINGRVKRIKNQYRLYVSVEQLGQIISVEVDKDSIESL